MVIEDKILNGTWPSKNCHSDFAISFLKQESCIFMEYSDFNEVMYGLSSLLYRQSCGIQVCGREKKRNSQLRYPRE